MRKGVLILCLLFLTACSNEVDITNKIQSEVYELNSIVTKKDLSNPDFESGIFFEKQMHQLNSWKNNLKVTKVCSGYRMFEHDGEINVLLYINGRYAYASLKDLPQSYNDYYYDTFIYDDKSQEFRLFSSDLRAASLSVIAISN